ncbi:MAG: hypothetical protein SFW65_00775 [Alphaproteobacteria bacterium]|nr:hypothetical protein [Alphaproteobacteria bacterium]
MTHTAATINALDDEAVLKLKADDIIALGADAANLSLRVLHVLEKPAFEAIDGAYFRPGKLNKLIEARLKNITPKQAAGFTDDTVQGLTAHTIQLMEKGARKSIDVTKRTVDQINETPPWAFAEMDVTNVRKISPEMIVRLSGHKIAYLIKTYGAPIALDSLTTIQLEGVLKTYSGNLPSELLEQLATVKPEVAENLTTSTILGLSVEEAKALGYDTAARKELAHLITEDEQRKISAKALINMPSEVRAELSGAWITGEQLWNVLGEQRKAAYNKFREAAEAQQPGAEAEYEKQEYSTLLTPNQLAALDTHIVRATRPYALNTMVTSELAIIARRLENEQLAKLNIRKAYELGKLGFIPIANQGYVPMRRLAAFVGRRLAPARLTAAA